MLILDTSALLYWLFAPEQLSATAASAIAETDVAVLSSISIWEIGLKVKRSKLVLPMSTEALVALLNLADKVRIDPVTELVWLKNLSLDWEHKDPADRTIVATALLLACPLVTSDHEIGAFYSETIW